MAAFQSFLSEKLLDGYARSISETLLLFLSFELNSWAIIRTVSLISVFQTWETPVPGSNSLRLFIVDVILGCIDQRKFL